MRWAGAVILAISVWVGSACHRSPTSEPAARPSAEAVQRNDRILQSIPAFPGARLEARNDIEGPRGGKGAGSHLHYRTDNADRIAIVQHFKAHLAEWSVAKEEPFPTRNTVTFVRGDAWFQVSATDIADSQRNYAPVPGYVVVVNAHDAKVLTTSK